MAHTFQIPRVGEQLRVRQSQIQPRRRRQHVRRPPLAIQGITANLSAAH